VRLQYFGDSYDIVKKALIGWLGEFGDWTAHPMFTEPVSPEEAEMFSRFLGVRLISTDVLTPKTDRAAYMAPCRGAGNLFLDPDTGVRLQARGGANSVNYVFGQELIALSRTRPGALTLVFDQSYSRGDQNSQVREKLSYLMSQGAYGFAYCSHAPFLLVGVDAKLVSRAYIRLLDASGLPHWRFVATA
jgi:hypothetical protein